MPFLDPGRPDALAASTTSAFAELHGRPPLVVGRAPGRVNLIGEHTDYNAGLCLPLALPHATYAALAVRDDGRVRVASRQTPDVWEGDLADAGPGGVDGWAAYAVGVLWALREDGLDVPGCDVLVDSTVPFGSGLSSSAALECAVAVAVCGALGVDLDDDRRRAVARACMRAESEVAGAPTGGMDQTVAMLARAGGALLLDFDDPDPRTATRVVPLALDEAGLALLVTDTRVSHALVDTGGDGGYAARRADCEHAASLLGVSSLRHAEPAAVETLGDDRVRRRARHVVTEIARVAEAVESLRRRDWASLGELLAASHGSMRDDFEISCAELDTAVEAATAAGALGARMTGGGFGGSSVALVPAGEVERVAAAVDEAFAAAGFAAPRHLRAEPSDGAGVVLP